jgi:hypothetical protein
VVLASCVDNTLAAIGPERSGGGIRTVVCNQQWLYPHEQILTTGLKLLVPAKGSPLNGESCPFTSPKRLYLSFPHSLCSHF